ncbi:energy transducer TonB [uncultured Sphingomonas sp.]|uniref:energy transducer TonB n=1 Tax=uncultured Sphingomonas sp. TaxID=158754 RepID=UPI0025D818F4|nr:energy transducer TonB [uncultured Sphingomonas sp.]
MTMLALGQMAMELRTPVQVEKLPKPEIVGDMAAAFGPDNYPPAAQRAHEEGLVIADLTVDAQGRVTGCTISQSASASLDEQTCHIVVSTPGLFRAARDRGGRAVASHHTLRIRWQIPEDAPNGTEVAHSGATLSEMIVDVDGHPTECQVHTLPVNFAVTNPPCPSSTEGLQAAVMQRSGATTPPRFRYFAIAERIFGDGPLLSGPIPKDMTVLQRFRVDFTIDATGKAVDCRWTVSVGPVDTEHIPTLCQRDQLFAIEPNMPKSGYDYVQIAYQILPPRP